jgi:FtsP/CotA-like multicopper oxidase with cupredoxin domain
MRRVEMDKTIFRTVMVPLAAVFLALLAVHADARIEGISGNTFNLTAKVDHMVTPDGGSLMIWGYANGNGRAQYPGPTLIVNQGETVTVNLTNDLDVPASIVFPGHDATATGGTAGLLTGEASPGEVVTYTFTATRAGTYLYHSGTNPEIQVEMGLVGALIVRPEGFDSSAPRAYNHPDSGYDYEVLFFLSEMDPRIHEVVETQGVAALENTGFLSDYFPNYWFINGRSAPDTMASASSPWLPTQPYNCFPRVTPGDRLLMRVINAGRDLHPYHHHGNHARIIARDGRLLESSSGAGADLSFEVFTVQSVPGETVDAIFQWTGKGLGWDIYGTAADGPEFVHDCTDANGDDFDDATHEYCPDHDKPFPVTLPPAQDLTFGGFYSGSPFLGVQGSLPPGEGGLNPYGGFPFMWHSHTEKEMTNYDIFPGGMMTMMIIEPPGTEIE